MYILFDVGGTSIRFASSSDGKRLDAKPIKVPTPKNFDAAVVLFERIGTELAGKNRILAVGGGIAGPMNREKSKLVHSPNLVGWENQPFKERLADMFNCPVYLENDAALAGLGEAVFGAGNNDGIVVYVTVSTGIGGTRIVHGKIDRNRYGFEPGHQIIDTAGGVFGDNKSMTLEQLASGTALERRYGRAPSEITDERVWDEEARLLAIGLHNMSMHWSPDIIILGGGVVLTTRLSIDRIREYLAGLPSVFRGSTIRIEKAMLGDSSGLYGALAYLKNVIK